MSGYDNTNSGALFRAKEKKSENHPDYTGVINVNGVDCWLSGWVKESKEGQKYFSLAVTPKSIEAHAKAASPKEAQAQAAPLNLDDDFDDDIPF